MKSTIPFLSLGVQFLLIFSLTGRGEDNVAPSGFRALFNGKDLSGWHGLGHFDPRKLESMTAAQRAAKRSQDMESVRAHWKVENSAIVNDGKGVYLTTDEEFGDMELLIDYWTVAKADSGIYLRANPQVQIWDFTEAGGKWHIGADKGSGGLWNNSPGAPGKDPLSLADKPFGEWNRFRILQVGDKTTIFLNDRLVVDHARMENFWDRKNPLWPKGPIQLQTHGGEIRWKNIFVREIPADEANLMLSEPGFKTLFNGTDLSGWGGAVDGWEARNGTLACKAGSGGTIYHQQTYSDFIVRFEFKLPPGGNNGLAIRYPGSGDTAYVGMCELQVLDNSSPRYAELDSRQYHGSAYGIAAALRGFQRPVGTWNYQEVTVEDSRIVVNLNGTTILDEDLGEIDEYMGNRPHPGKDRKSGYFGFAGHGDAVQFRNVRAKALR